MAEAQRKAYWQEIISTIWKDFHMNENETTVKEVDEDLTADGHLSGVELDSESEPQDPFDPEQISIDTKVVPMDTLIRRILQGSIRLAPAFQRNVVWDLERKSRLIESMMLNIPLPMFYVAADEKGNWDVVDGLQRLTTIKNYILGEDFLKSREESQRGRGFRLASLEFWGSEFDNKTFKELDTDIVNRILETEFRFTIINPGTPEVVKRNIFKRINTGGMPLTLQEIRHALYQGQSTNILLELSHNQQFQFATGGSVDDSRMAARELVLRFLSFSLRSHKDYSKASEMDTFLSDTMRIMNVLPNPSQSDLLKIFKTKPYPTIRYNDIPSLKRRFITGMQRSFEIFSNHAFRRSAGGQRRSPINKTLFEVWGNLLSDLTSDQHALLKKNRVSFLNQYESTLLSDAGFIDIISRDSWKYTAVQNRYDKLGNFLSNYVI